MQHIIKYELKFGASLAACRPFISPEQCLAVEPGHVIQARHLIGRRLSDRALIGPCREEVFSI